MQPVVSILHLGPSRDEVVDDMAPAALAGLEAL